VIKLLVGIVLGLSIGAACRWFDIPVPSPPKLTGALLVVAMTVGYMATDKIIATKFSSKEPASTREMCGGPTGDVASKFAS
jgi:XapX domain-containing protein